MKHPLHHISLLPISSVICSYFDTVFIYTLFCLSLLLLCFSLCTFPLVFALRLSFLAKPVTFQPDFRPSPHYLPDLPSAGLSPRMFQSLLCRGTVGGFCHAVPPSPPYPPTNTGSSPDIAPRPPHVPAHLSFILLFSILSLSPATSLLPDGHLWGPRGVPKGGKLGPADIVHQLSSSDM